VRIKTAASKAYTILNQFVSNYPGYHRFSILAAIGALCLSMVACAPTAAHLGSEAVVVLTITPRPSAAAYTQDVPGLQTAIAQVTEVTDTPILEPGFTPTPNPSRAVGTGSISPGGQALEEAATATPPSASFTDTRLGPKYWREWPIVPTISAEARLVYQKGIDLGNNPHAFSRIGDCQSVPAVFMGLYDNKERYWLGNDYEFLQETIDQFAGSFSRESLAAKDGFGVATVLSPLRANPENCKANEAPIECEFRIQKPILVFVAMGTNWAPAAELTFEKYLRQIVEISIEHGTIPILVTKADNIEEDFKLNEAIARVAYDYHMPLFNAWRAVQFLKNHGLEDNGVYLTVDAWNIRDFTGLRTLDSIWQGLNGHSEP
jgi:hypothetical protein